MAESQFLALVEQALNAPRGSVRLEDRLHDLSGWDSLGAMSVIAVLDQHLGVSLGAGALTECQTVADLNRLVGSGRAA